MNRALAVAATFAVAAAVACTDRHPASNSGAAKGHEMSSDWFVEAAETSGLDFVHFNGMSGRFYYPEIIGPGVALFDYDNDGDLDVFLVQGRMLGAGTPVFPAPPASGLKGRLFRNDLTVGADGRRTLKFTDVTDESGIEARGYGMGVAAGDFDNDGCVDLYLTNLGANQLYHNNCDGTFTDVSAKSGTADPSWSVSAAFLDYDRDGWLDLFVGNYLYYTTDINTSCFGPSGLPDYCSPNVYRAQPSRLFHNNHDGTFTDVTERAGLSRDFGPALGVTTADFNGDGWIDFYVANDGHENQLWINQRDGTFRNVGLLSGTALSAHGRPKAGMGVDAGDFDNDGDEDIFVTNLTGEGNDLYVNDGSATFEEQSGRSGLGAGSLGFTGFGAAWADFDNDGWLDTLIVNGAVRTIEALRQAHDPFPLHQRKLLFRNRGDGRFDDLSARGGPALQLSEVSRGAAFGDIDNDGDIDVVVANNSGRTRLLINMIGNHNHWIGLRVVGKTARPLSAPRPARIPSGAAADGMPAEGRDMLGARVAVVRQDGSTLWRRARSDASYASANDPRVLFGLGASDAPPRAVRVVWPDGRSEEWTGVPLDRYTTLIEGTGK